LRGLCSKPRVGVIELKAAPEDVMTPGIWPLISRREETVRPLTSLIKFTVKGAREREREGGRDGERGAVV